ncbi:MAG: sigma-70 family RNA polymerase sigma factor [Planctomycetes bacterium]|nr:sigma-70 family RNA polymerase sigma factor [Planctomycetota bacterium]
MSSITHTALLVGLQSSSNDEVWSDFYTRYQPLLVAVGRRLGLAEQDALDAAQETLLSFAEGYRKGKYDRSKGRLRTWLFGIAVKKIRDIQRRNGKNHAVVEPVDKTRVLSAAPDDHSISEVWESEWERRLLQVCMENVCRHMEVSTVQAFELFVLKEWPADRVASHLGVSRNAVFKAKRRVLSRMRETYKYLQANW